MKDFLVDFSEFFVLVGKKENRIPLSLFLVLCLNVLLSPIVQATTPGDIPRWQAYNIAFLGFVTVALSIYLFVVIFQPERF
ncbi:K+-transporting ATPase subunit F [Calothrix sp. NIES-4101]|nr:K+-transporting ATPase subunit F [Calothrix sp. NIES-4101]